MSKVGRGCNGQIREWRTLVVVNRGQTGKGVVWERLIGVD